MDLSLVKTGLATLLQKNTMAAMDGIFSQVRGREDTGREGKGEGVFLIRVLYTYVSPCIHGVQCFILARGRGGQSSVLGM